MGQEEEAQVKEDIWRKDDMVEHPAHYTAGGVECIDAIKASMDGKEYAGFLKGQVLKYMWRFEKKWNPIEDVKKARFYLEKLISFMEENPNLFTDDMDFTINVKVPEIEESTVSVKQLADMLIGK